MISSVGGTLFQKYQHYIEPCGFLFFRDTERRESFVHLYHSITQDIYLLDQQNYCSVATREMLLQIYRLLQEMEYDWLLKLILCKVAQVDLF